MNQVEVPFSVEDEIKGMQVEFESLVATRSVESLVCRPHLGSAGGGWILDTEAVVPSTAAALASPGSM